MPSAQHSNRFAWSLNAALALLLLSNAMGTPSEPTRVPPVDDKGIVYAGSPSDAGLPCGDACLWCKGDVCAPPCDDDCGYAVVPAGTICHATPKGSTCEPLTAPPNDWSLPCLLPDGPKANASEAGCAIECVVPGPAAPLGAGCHGDCWEASCGLEACHATQHEGAVAWTPVCGQSMDCRHDAATNFTMCVPLGEAIGCHPAEGKHEVCHEVHGPGCHPGHESWVRRDDGKA